MAFRYRLLEEKTIDQVVLFDMDLGQSLVTPGGCLSLELIEQQRWLDPALRIEVSPAGGWEAYPGRGNIPPFLPFNREVSLTPSLASFPLITSCIFL